MLETSADILKITLAVCAVALTGFICWGIYSFTKIVRQVARIIDHIESLVGTIQTQVEKLHELFSLIEEKIKHLGSTLPLILTGVKSIMEFLAKRKAAKSKTKSAS